MASNTQKSAFDSAVASAQPKPRKKKEAGPPRAFKDDRMPPVGTILESMPVAGKVIKVEVCDNFVKPRSNKPDGTRFSRQSYRSLSAVMAEARGMPSNGWFWFGLGELRGGKVINARDGDGGKPKAKAKSKATKKKSKAKSKAKATKKKGS